MFEFASVPVAYFLWAVFGLFGGHRFYVGRWESGLVYMFTLGGCFVGWIIDFFILSNLVEEVSLVPLCAAALPPSPSPSGKNLYCCCCKGKGVWVSRAQSSRGMLQRSQLALHQHVLHQSASVVAVY